MPAIATTETNRTIITAEGGTYALILYCSGAELVQIGKLGPLVLRRGFYVYVGSALGPGGVRARVAHHQKVSQRPHWHIDYLRPHTRLDRIWYSHDKVRREHQWARLINALWGASVPIAGFGSSDCRCATHLFFFKRRPSFGEFRERAGGASESSSACVVMEGRGFTACGKIIHAVIPIRQPTERNLALSIFKPMRYPSSPAAPQDDSRRRHSAR